MLNYSYIGCALLFVLCSGCGAFSKADPSRPVREVRIEDPDGIVPAVARAIVGEEVRWHNELAVPIHVGFLGVRPITEISCGKGFKTWLGEIKDIVTIRAGDYVSACFSHPGTLRYNVWTDLGDPLHSMSPVAILYLEQAG